MLHCWCTFIEDEKRVAALSIQIKKLFFLFLPSHPHDPSEMPCLSGIQGREGKD